MSSTKDIRRRIKSIKSTRQITKAMELVAAAKMRKAQIQAAATRTYAKLAWELVNNLAKATNPRLHRLLDGRAEVKKLGLIVVSSNRGLAGSFNKQIFNAVIRYAKAQKAEVELFTLGKKVRDALRKTGGKIVADFEKIDFNLKERDVKLLTGLAIGEFVAGKYDRIAIAYMDFISTLVQKPQVKQILPILEPIEGLGEVGEPSPEYLFEPTADQVLESVLPRLVGMQIYQAVLETNASEHSARMVAMKNASDAASDLVDELTLDYNQLRQAAITKEISEIVAGKLALNQ